MVTKCITMTETTLIRDLTETEILSAVREMFQGEHVTAVKLEPLIDQSETLGDLYTAIRNALNEIEHGYET
jgi:hypothetical protein